MTTEIHSTDVNLSGLLDVLDKNLYSLPVVALRELMQNAHDAIVRRRVETSDLFGASITLHCDAARKTLIIDDTSAGLTLGEVLSYLATIGSGYTRLPRDSDPNAQAIGYFGLGFLSAYVASTKVEVWTTSYRGPDVTWQVLHLKTVQNLA